MRSSGAGFRWLRRVLLAGAALAGVVLALHVVNRARFGMAAFDAGAERLLDRSRELQRRASRFDQAGALRALAPNAVNGFVYRFDDELGTATLDALGTDAREASPSGRPPIRVAHEQLGGQLRRVLRMQTPRALTYPVVLPADPETLTLSVGLGVPEAAPPAEFSVTARTDEESHRLLRRIVRSGGAWHDVELDLTAYRGRRIDLRFEATSESPGVALWSNAVLHGPPARRFNVMVVLEDTLRADHLSAYGYARQTSPVKDFLAEQGVVFERAFAQATKTRPSCPALMTSLYPTATGVWTHPDVLHERYLTLAEVFRAQGFVTASFIQNGNAGPVAGLHQGFGLLVYDPDVRAELYGSYVQPWIARHAHRNFFLYVHLVDPHSPYDPPPGYRAWHREAADSEPVKRRRHYEPDWVQHATVENRRARYDGEIAFNDHHFGRLIDWLRAEGLLDDTLLVFLSDHGEHLGEHGSMWEHQPPGYRQVLHVPLLMRYPKALPAGTRVGAPVQLIDVMPTVLEIAGIDSTPFLMQGDSLVSLVEGREQERWEQRVAFSEEVTDYEGRRHRPWASVFFRDWHLLNSRSFPPPMLGADDSLVSPRTAFLHLRVFDQARDFDEVQFVNGFFFDVLLKHRIDRFVRELQAVNRAFSKAMAPEPARAPADPAALEQLRALGYIE